MYGGESLVSKIGILLLAVPEEAANYIPTLTNLTQYI